MRRNIMTWRPDVDRNFADTAHPIPGKLDRLRTGLQTDLVVKTDSEDGQVMPYRSGMLKPGLLAILAVLAFAGPASAWELGIWDGEAQVCDNQSVLKKIERRFRHQVKHVPHLPDVRIDAIERIHQHRYLPARENRPIARRYCHGTAQLSDGRRKKIWYLIEDHQGFAGIGDNVEFCVSGFDRWNVYNSYCRILR